jgi:hypothetical protein
MIDFGMAKPRSSRGPQLCVPRQAYRPGEADLFGGRGRSAVVSAARRTELEAPPLPTRDATSDSSGVELRHSESALHVALARRHA